MAKAKRKKHPNYRHKNGLLTKSLTGIVKLSEGFDERKFMSEVLAEKFGLDKWNDICKEKR